MSATMRGQKEKYKVRNINFEMVFHLVGDKVSKKKEKEEAAATNFSSATKFAPAVARVKAHPSYTQRGNNNARAAHKDKNLITFINPREPYE